jgi:shikimate dehydrogenase
VGSNTDGEGFVAALRHGDGFEPQGKKCLVIGAGGAARAVVLALAEAGAAEVIVVNRTESRATAAAALAGPVGRVGRPEEAETADLVVNATPAGMAGAGANPGSDPDPGSDSLPLDTAYLVAGQVVVDLVYHPAVTPWLLAARERGAVTHNGLGMLVHQAAAQLRSWTGKEPPVAAMWQAATAALGTR